MTTTLTSNGPLEHLVVTIGITSGQDQDEYEALVAVCVSYHDNMIQ
jgi:hypothetical protein